MARERWNSQFGVVLAVAGSAVGLGNFLRFPGNAAQYGGGAFMLAYFISLLILGLPMCWAEWTMGRHGGAKGFSSSPGILGCILRHKAGAYVGVLGVIIPVVIYMYYVYIEAWCLGYAVNFALGNMHFSDAAASGAFWSEFIGEKENGTALGVSLKEVGGFLIFVFILNFILIYRGISKGIEWFCTLAMPTLLVLALIVLVRVLTLGTPDPAKPDANVANGLGFMWNPTKVLMESKAPDGTWQKDRELVGDAMIAAGHTEAAAASGTLRIREVGIIEQLQRPQLWLAAVGQIFFSLSVGFGVIITYSSYLTKKDDVVLSGLAATSANEFCEVTLGGLITLPASVAFLGVSGIVSLSTFGLGFHVLPCVFNYMPGGQWFGAAFFFLLFLAAVTSSLSMLQPGIAFLEESMGIKRRASVAILGVITALGCWFVVYFSADVKALDTLDFWVGTFLIYILATIQIIAFGWKFGVDRGFREAHEGAAIRIPAWFKPVFKFVCPIFLITIFVVWMTQEVLGLGGGKPSSYILDLFGPEKNKTAILSIGLVLLVGSFFALLVARSPTYKNFPEDVET